MKFLTQLSQRKLYRIVLCLAVAVFLLANLCASLAGERFNWKLDMTGEKLYEFSQTTLEVAEDLSEKTEIYVLASEKDYPSMFREVLSRYGKLSANLAVSYVDPFENPLFVDHYKTEGYTLSANDLLVSGSSGLRQIAYDDMLVYSEEEVTGIKIEQAVTSAIIYVNRGQKPVAAFTTGHNERTGNALEGLFRDNNFQIRSLTAAAPEPGDADLVVIASPARDFAPEETARLEEYLQQGGKIMAFMEPAVASYPNLSGFLAKWGLGLESNVVFEEKAYVSDNPLNLIPIYGPHGINTYFAENPYYVVMPASRGIQILSGIPDLKVTPVLQSTGNAYGKSKLQYDSTARAPEDASGPFVLAAISEKTVWVNDEEASSAVFLAGSRSLYADDIMSVETYANRQFLTQAVNYLTESGDSVSIPPKTLTKPPLTVTMQSSMLIGAVLVVLLPLGVLAAGIVVYRKRKNL